MDDLPRSILIIVFLIIAGGFFAGAETAYAFTNKVRLELEAQENSRRAQKAVRILDDFDTAVVTLLIVINIVHIAASSIATSLFIEITGSSTWGPVSATVIITLAIFIFSETIPKNFAKTNADAYVRMFSPVLYCLMVLLKPLSLLLTGFGELVKKIFRIKDTEPSVTEDEFSAMVEDAGEEDVFEPGETEIIKSAIGFGDTTVGEIMTPREKIVAIPLKADDDEIKRILIEEKYSRFPVYRGSLNNIVGIVRTTNALWQMITENEDFVLRENMTKPIFCTPEDRVDDVFERMCNRKNHFAVVKDEDDKTVGIVTMEDILEEIVGEIYDEDDSYAEGEEEDAVL